MVMWAKIWDDSPHLTSPALPATFPALGSWSWPGQRGHRMPQGETTPKPGWVFSSD